MEDFLLIFRSCWPVSESKPSLSLSTSIGLFVSFPPTIYKMVSNKKKVNTCKNKMQLVADYQV